MRWVLGAVAVLALAYAFELGLLVYAMLVLLGVLAVSRVMTREWIDRLEVDRECSRLQCAQGDKVAVLVHLHNTSRWLSIGWLLVEDSIPREALTQRPPRIELDGRRTALLQLGPQGRESLRYQVRFLMRGYYQLGPVLLESGDFFGLHRRFRIETRPQFVLVTPRVIPLAGFEIASRRPMGEVRLAHRLFEDPTRISGVREYQPGDPLRRVHWKASARTGVLHSKQYEASSVVGVTLVLDFHSDEYPAREEPNRSELAVTTVASLANAVCLLGRQVGLVTNARDAADRIREEGYTGEFRTRTLARQVAEGTGRSDRLRPVIVPTRRRPEQFTRIQETLARAELTDGLTLAQLLVEAASQLPRNATVVAVVPAASEQTALALGGLVRRGYTVVAIHVLPDEQTNHVDASRLLAAGVEVLPLPDEAALATLCAAVALR
jgi:uncharacterized protein (DUF58 family)